MRRLEAFRGTEADVFPDVPICDPESRRTKPPAHLRFPTADHRERTPITALSSFCRFQEQAPEQERRRREASSLAKHNPAAYRPRAPRFGARRPPNPPMSIGPVRRLDVDRCQIGDTAEDGPHTSTPQREQAALARPSHVQSDNAEPVLARSDRSACN